MKRKYPLNRKHRQTHYRQSALYVVLDKLKQTFKRRNRLSILFLLFAFKCYAVDGLYVGEKAYINGPSVSGTIDAIGWYSDRPNDIMISGDKNGATIYIIQYFSGIATIECQYAYHYYVGTKRYNQTGHSKINISCKASTVSINQDELVLAPGSSVTLSYTNSSGYQIPYPYWEIDDSKIATIDDYYRSTEHKIIVKGIAPGTTTINFYANSGNKNPTCKVTVKEIPATAINLSPKSLSINEGKTVFFSVTLTPQNATSKISWSTNNESIATINTKGVIKGIKEGTTTVTARTENGLTATGIVNIVPQPTDIKLPSTLTLFKGYNIALTPILTPLTAVTKYKWKSDSPKIVDVDATGNVFAKNNGTANITVITENGIQTTISIIVIDPEEDLDYRNIKKRIEVINELLNETIKIIN